MMKKTLKSNIRRSKVRTMKSLNSSSLFNKHALKLANPRKKSHQPSKLLLKSKLLTDSIIFTLNPFKLSDKMRNSGTPKKQPMREKELESAPNWPKSREESRSPPALSQLLRNKSRLSVQPRLPPLPPSLSRSPESRCSSLNKKLSLRLKLLSKARLKKLWRNS
jgi:hypothetical protein